MEIITNDLLAYFDLENLEAFKEIKESPELKDIHQKKKENSLNEYLSTIGTDSSVKMLIKNVKSEDERTVLLKLVHLKHYFTKSVKTEIKNQIKACEKFLKSDMCLRNTILKEQVDNEIEKLALAHKYDLVKIAVNSLYDLYTYLYPGESKEDIAVKVSETMRQLSIYRSKNKPFLYEKESQDYLDENPDVVMYEGKEKIYYRIKDDLVKGRNRFLLR